MNKNRIDLLKSLIKERILFIDGSMGVMIQKYKLNEYDYRGDLFNNNINSNEINDLNKSIIKKINLSEFKDILLKGNSEILSITQPEVITSIHKKMLEAGADIITTNTLNADSVSQSEFKLEKISYELNFASAKLACIIAGEIEKLNPKKPRFIAGSIGNTNKSLSISPDVNDPSYRNISFDQLVTSYKESVRGLVDGGVDILLIETIFDTLNCKAAIYAIKTYFEENNVEIPIIISATITDASGRTLSGQTLEAFYYSIIHANPLSIGLNCSLGVDEIKKYIIELSKFSNLPIIVYPNAGLPNEFGEYIQSPQHMSEVLKEIAEEGYLNIVGGCCGTTPLHIKAIVDSIKGIKPRKIPENKHLTSFSGLEPLVIRNDSLFINIGERTNVAGSKKFLDLIKNKNYMQALEIAREQIVNGAQIIDINMDESMLDSEKEMEKFLKMISSEPDICKIPVMIDSSKWSVVQTGLKCIQGKCIVNSISLKEGEDEFIKKAKEIQKYGAGIIVMAFDEKGQAESMERKVDICKRAYKILTEIVKFQPEDIIFDPNIFAIGTGIKEHQNYASDYIKAVKIIKKELPYCKISGGISNLSFAFRGNNTVREAIHSVFLYHAIKSGMDMGIVNPGQLTIYNEIPSEFLERIEDLVLNKRDDATDRLLEFAATVKDESFSKKADILWRKKDLKDKIKYSLMNGITTYLEEDIIECIKKFNNPVDIIEGPLMEGMNEVGELFGSGKMFLPQVVKSARVMKNAVSLLMPYLEKDDLGKVKKQTKGKILMATVKGDVHDIGKNIVSVILQCNNYEIIDIGVMVTAEKIINEAINNKVDVIGLSGLITPSLDEIINVVAEMQKYNLNIPVIIGGATTSKLHTAVKISPKYDYPVVHVKDASLAPIIVNKLLNPEIKENFKNQLLSEYKELRDKRGIISNSSDYLSLLEVRKNKFKPDFNRFMPIKPSFLGIKKLNNYPLAEIIKYINWSYFFNSWSMKKKFPDILKDNERGTEAKKLYNDALNTLDEIISNKSLTANGVIGFFPAFSLENDDIEVYTDDNRKKVLSKISFLRQQYLKNDNKYYLSLSDFIASKKSEINDYIGFFAVTAGIGLDKICKKYKNENNDYKIIMFKTLADRLAEAFTELLHEKVRKEYWAYSRNENLSKEDLFDTKYKGIRPAPGYPACPDHSDKTVIFNILDAEKNAFIKLNKNFMMIPESSVCGYYFSSYESMNFGVGKITKEQVIDYSKRKNISLEKAEKLLSTLLAY